MAYCPAKHIFFFTIVILIVSRMITPSFSSGETGKKNPVYVGSSACGHCHEAEYGKFMTYAKKSRSFESVEKMKKGLTEDEIKKCFLCHTTGYGKPGGFVSAEKTPQLKNAGCEVCHGPGEFHVKTKKPGDIKGKMTLEDCEKCHTSERVRAFRFKPLIHGGAH